MKRRLAASTIALHDGGFSTLSGLIASPTPMHRGCKDYGEMTLKHGDPGLKAHTEDSPIRPPPESLRPRMNFGLSLLQDKRALFDATVLRPTIVYGRSSSNYGALFDLASTSTDVLTMQADPNAIMHSLHVDDCADAYVALAQHPVRRRRAAGIQYLKFRL